MPKKKPEPRASRPVLVPIDFSPHSEAALLWAVKAAHCMETELLVLHVVHDPASTPGYYQTKKKGLRRLEEAAQEMLEDFLARMRQKHSGIAAFEDLRAKLVVGLPVTRILEVAEKTCAQLMVVGSQGRSGLPRFLLGSKAERLAQLSPIPITIVKAKLS